MSELNSLNIKEITGRLSYLAGESDPLSADVGIIRGDTKIWFFDVGAGVNALRFVREAIGSNACTGTDAIGSNAASDADTSTAAGTDCAPDQKSDFRAAAVISHFHTDHCDNLLRLPHDLPIYAGGYTVKRFRELPKTRPEVEPFTAMTAVDTDLYIDDGVKLHIFPLPSSHAKGSVGLEVDETYAFLGDAIYPKLLKDDPKGSYNVQLLIEEIRVLKALKADYVLLSHKPRFVQDKAGIIRYLEGILKKTRAAEANQT